jgi:hypothetical protein
MIDQGAQYAGGMSTLGVIQIVPGEWGTEFLEDRNKLAARECLSHVRPERQRDANSRGDQATVERRIR